MNRYPEPRRTVLTLLFVLWLSAQSIVVAVSPAWGFVLPHEHITRGVLSERAWQEHLREHRLGTGQFFEIRCDVPLGNASPVMASVPDAGGALSLFSGAASLHNALVEIPAFGAPQARLCPMDFHVADITIAPLVPPPNL